MTILVLDIGSSSVRALLFDENITPLVMARRAHQFATTPPGAAILDMKVLQTQVEACIDEVLQHPAATGIRVVGMDTFAGNIVGMNAEGNAVTPIFSYADTRSAEAVLELKAHIDIEATHQRTGCVHHTAYLPGRLQWLKSTDFFKDVALWIDLGGYLYRQWFGKAVTSYSIAAWNGLLNRERCDWDSGWLKILDVSNLPPLADYDQPLMGLSEAYAAQWPILNDVPFMLAVGDGAAANVGAGCVDEQKIALTVGTTAALRVITSDDLPKVPRGLWSYRVSRRQHLTGGATSEGGNIYKWVYQTFGLDRIADVDAEIAKRRPFAHQLNFLPLLAGERSPGWHPEASGAIVGLRLSTEPLDLLQAGLEGVALRLSLIKDQLPFEQAEIVASGGALAASRVWEQIIANALNCRIHLTEEAEITARGTAILALHAIGQCALDDFLPQITAVVEPQADTIELFREARERQEALYQKLLE